MARRALLVGVPETTYGSGSFARLPGAHDDAVRLGHRLRASGVDDLLVPSGDSLTEGAVKDALLRLVDQTGPDDLGIFYFSGHGFRYEDHTGEEDDGWDESIVCSDRPIGDDWFGVELWPTARPGSQFVVVIDACHSASSATFLDRPRFSGLPVRREGDTPFHRVVLSACGDSEEAGDADDGGMVTGAMFEVLDADDRLTHLRLWAKVGEIIFHRYGPQGIGAPHAGWSGPDDRLLHAPAFCRA